jgi:hypothetical protein
MVLFEAHSRHLLQETDENYDVSYSEVPVSGSRFEAGTFITRNRSTVHLAVTFWFEI